MVDFNFSQIRNHDGSQDNGFEELICQLAHLTPPENANYFVRKDGAGGDAGVECYWKLKDGTEHAWQAKYFPNRLESAQWSQITESVETALNKHPDLTKYTVCLPRDWNDSRKAGSDGKPVKSSLDKWFEHITKWKALAKSLGRTVEFTYWGQHEISTMLLRDDASFSGCANYWFDASILNSHSLVRLAKKSQASLGERYSPEHNLELPIQNLFEGLTLSDSWWKEINTRIKCFEKNYYESYDLISYLDKEQIIESSFKLSLLEFTQRITKLSEIKDIKEIKTLDQEFFDALNFIELKFSESQNHLNEEVIDCHIEKDFEKSDFLDPLIKACRKIQLSTTELVKSFTDQSFHLGLKGAALLQGEAGIGKSHLLCDITLNRLQQSMPTIFMLGQHYTGGNPLDALKRSLDVSSIQDQTFLGALDALGQAHRSRTLIVIDAINEGKHQDEWCDHIGSLLADIANFDYICIAISCRMTYVDYLIPEHIKKNQLEVITHYGFRGFEHRAADKYLTMQGIVKPSAPIISPEFTNPLFLKTCCKAILSQGLTAFPKGLQGISSLADFYIQSIERNACDLKGYRCGEKVVGKAIQGLVLALYPDAISGIPLDQAVELINNFDSRPMKEPTLFDFLLHEGVISEDIEYLGKQKKYREVVRFTYERFSDFFIAETLTESLSQETAKTAFQESGILSLLGSDKTNYKYINILTALNISIAEKFELELIDLLSEKFSENGYFFENVFIDTLQWRTPESFTSRTLELFNEINGSNSRSLKLDVLLKLSTEPNHPWNAELLHAHLIKMQMPARDAYWSTYIAINDYEESEEEGESIIRSIIDWAVFGKLYGVEPERIRLCAIALIWMTSTSNRKIRDQATKSVVRILAQFPELLQSLLDKFADVNDLYVLERLYAIAYGVITNIQNNKLLKETAEWVWNNTFADSYPTPHILLRDYARGILELALHRNVLKDEITAESFRPPYKSTWPLHFPAVSELTALYGEGVGSSIKNSLMGFPGDFGNYTMRVVHDWSATPISEEKPKTADELQLEFAQILAPDLKERLLKHIESERDFQKAYAQNLSELLTTEVKVNFVTPEYKKEPSEFDLLKEEINASLNEDEQEYFRWVMGLGLSDSIATFSRKKAQRWICQRAYELGWLEELFADFERFYAVGHGRSQSQIERIGKKYQWIAFHEFLAHLADNCLFIDKGYHDIDHSQYLGPWQLYKRDIDPTSLIRSTADNGWKSWDKDFWWQPFNFSCKSKDSALIQQWLTDEKLLPPFERLLKVKDPNSSSWIVLKTFSSWRKRFESENGNILSQDNWYRVNSCIIKKNDLSALQQSIQDSVFLDPDVLRPNSSGHQRFYREYPWHPSYKDLEGWKTEFGSRIKSNTEHLIPVSLYEWESGSKDHSIEDSISFYLPSKELIENLKLTPNQKHQGEWVNSEETTIFFDPCISNVGPSAGLIKQSELVEWLEKNEYQLVWLVGGEKQLFKGSNSDFLGRLEFSGIYLLTENKVVGNLNTNLQLQASQ